MRRRGDADTTRPWLRVLVGSLAATAGAAGLAFAAGGWADRAAYGRAPFCDGAVTRDCLRDTTAEVVATREIIVRFRGAWSVDLDVEGRAVDVIVPEDGEETDAGTRAPVRLWRGAVVLVGGDGRLLRTHDHPHVNAVDTTTFAWFALSWGAHAVVSGVALARAGGWWKAPELPDATRVSSRAYRVTYVSAATAIAPFFLQSSLDVYEVPVLLLGAAAGAAIAVRNLSRDAAAPAGVGGASDGEAAPVA